MEGYIIRTEDKNDLREQMRSRMREQYRASGSYGAVRPSGNDFENGYREGYREGYEHAMHDMRGGNYQGMAQQDRDPYMTGMRDSYGRNGAENNRNRDF